MADNEKPPEAGTQEYVEKREEKAQEILAKSPGMSRREAIVRAGAEIRGTKVAVDPRTGFATSVGTSEAEKQRIEHPPELEAKKPPKQAEVSQPPTLPDVTTPQGFAEKYTMSEKAAQETITRYKSNPQSPEFSNLNANQLIELNRLAGRPRNTNLIEVGIQKGGSEYVTKADYDALPTDLQDTLRKEGTAGFEAKARRFIESVKEQEKITEREYGEKNVKVPDGYWLPKADVEKIKADTPKLYQTLVSKGYEPYMAEFLNLYKKMPDGYVEISAYNDLINTVPAADRKRYETIANQRGWAAAVKEYQDDWANSVKKTYPAVYDTYVSRGFEPALTQFKKEFDATLSRMPEVYQTAYRESPEAYKTLLNRREAVIARMERDKYIKFLSHPTLSGEPQTDIDIVGAIRSGKYARKDLVSVVGEDAVSKAEQYIKDVDLISQYDRPEQAIVASFAANEAVKRLYPDDYKKISKGLPVGLYETYPTAASVGKVFTTDMLKMSKEKTAKQYQLMGDILTAAGLEAELLPAKAAEKAGAAVEWAIKNWQSIPQPAKNALSAARIILPVPKIPQAPGYMMPLFAQIEKGTLKAQEWTGEQLAKLNEWAAGQEGKKQIGANILSGFTELFTVIPQLAGTSIAVLSQQQQGKYKEIAQELTNLGVGMVLFPQIALGQITRTPIAGGSKAVGYGIGMIITPITLAKMAEKGYLKAKASIKRGVTADSLRVETEFPRGDIPYGTTTSAALAAMQLAAEAASSKLFDRTLVDPTTGIKIRVTPVGKAAKVARSADVTFELSLNVEDLINDLKTEGVHEVYVKRDNAADWGEGRYATRSLWLQRVETATRIKDLKTGEYKPIDPAIVAYVYERRQVPAAVQKLYDSGKVNVGTDLFLKMEREGKLEAGLYEIFKQIGSAVEVEDYIVKGTKLYNLKPGTKITQKVVISDKNYYRVDATGKRVKVISKGQPVTMYYVRVGSIKPQNAAGIVTNTLADYVFEPMQTAKRMLATRPTIGIGYGGIKLGEIHAVTLSHIKSPHDFLRDNTALYLYKQRGVKGLAGETPTGLTVVGDLHGVTNNLLLDINAGYARDIITGSEAAPSTWKWTGKRQKIVQLGDIVDRGKYYFDMRTALNRLADEAAATGGVIERVLGNHELAYLTGEKIQGIKYTNRRLTNRIRQSIIDDIKSGKVKAAVAENGQLFTHAGVSLDKFPEYRGKSAEYIANDLNRRFNDAFNSGKYTDPIFDIGASEGGKAAQGGIFWLRPWETTPENLNLGYKQFVGHTPTPLTRYKLEVGGKGSIFQETASQGISELTDNFIMTDVGRQVAAMYRGKPGIATMYKGQVRAYQDTPIAAMVRMTDKVAAPAGGRTYYAPLTGTGAGVMAVSALDKIKKMDTGNIIDWQDLRFDVIIKPSIKEADIKGILDVVNWELSKTSGDLFYKYVLAYPNVKNPAVLSLALRHMKSLNKLADLQMRINEALVTAGYPADAAKIRSDIIIGKIKEGVSTKQRMALMERVMKDQPVADIVGSVPLRVKNIKILRQEGKPISLAETKLSPKEEWQKKMDDLRLSLEREYGGIETARTSIELQPPTKYAYRKAKPSAVEYPPTTKGLSEYGMTLSQVYEGGGKPISYVSTYAPSKETAPYELPAFEYGGKIPYPATGYPATGYAPTTYAPTGYAPGTQPPPGYPPPPYKPTGYQPTGYAPVRVPPVKITPVTVTQVRIPLITLSKQPQQKGDLKPVTWYGGKLKQEGGKLKPQWFIIAPPYDKSGLFKQYSKPRNAIQVEGKGAAYKTIQGLGYSPRWMMQFDWGITDLDVSTPSNRGDRSAMKFKPDRKQRTKQRYSISDFKTLTQTRY